MKTIILVYGFNQYKIEDYENNLYNILNKYSSYLNKNFTDLLFLHKGKLLNLNNIKKLDNKKYNKITLLVSISKINIKNEKKELSDVKCPECNNLSRLYINEEKISLNNCVNKHNIIDLNINKFFETQFHKDSDIKCFICNNDINLYNNFFLCSCNNYFCPLCALNHDKKHYMIKYNERLHKCKHNNIFTSYCKTCNINLCEKCEEEHIVNKHNLVSYKEIIPNKKKLIEIKNQIIEIYDKLNRYKFEIGKLNNLYIKNMNNIIDEINKYLLIFDYFKNSIENLNNYERIKNITNFKKKKLMKEIDVFLNENINNK